MHREQSTSLYYTFSTISQTLAGAIGLLGAFVLFRFSSLNEVLRLSGANVLTGIDQDASRVGYSLNERSRELNRLWRDGNFVSFRTLYRSIKHSMDVSDATVRYIDDFESALAKKRSLLRVLIVALALTCLTLVFSVFVLCMTPDIVTTGSVNAVFIFGVSAFVGCLISYVVVILKALP